MMKNSECLRYFHKKIISKSKILVDNWELCRCVISSFIYRIGIFITNWLHNIQRKLQNHNLFYDYFILFFYYTVDFLKFISGLVSIPQTILICERNTEKNFCGSRKSCR